MDKENNGMEKHVIWKKSARILLVFVLLVGILFSGQADVRAAGKKVALNRTKVTLKVGESRKLTVSNAKKVTWSSTNKAVVSVNKSGRITAKKTGKASIVARAAGADGRSEAACRLFLMERYK